MCHINILGILIYIDKRVFLDMERGVCYLHRLGGITCLPLPEQAYTQLVTGPLPCQNCGKVFSSPDASWVTDSCHEILR